MEKFRDFTGLVAPFVRENIDTDQITPKQFLTSVHKTGYGLFLFNDERWVTPATDSSTTSDQLTPAPDFILNQPRYQGAQILLTGENFGCGSSREHAVWALTGYGFRAIIAPSFAEIFASNASKNMLLLICLPATTITKIHQDCLAQEGYQLEIVLSAASPYVRAAEQKYEFEIDASVKHRLLEGLDEIAITERLQDKIENYEQKRQQDEPWLGIS